MQAHTRGDVSSGSSYIVYELRLTLYGESWKVFRRFREFDDLNTELKLRYPVIMGALKFPPKKLWPNAQFLRQRLVDLEVFSSQFFLSFFALSSIVYFFKIYMREMVEKLHNTPASPFYQTRLKALMSTLPFFKPGESIRN